jgi:hypothetical protein
MILRKDPSVSLKLRYPIAVRVTTLISVLMLITLLIAFPRFGVKEFLEKEIHIEIEQFDIPQTQQFELPPPPSRPTTSRLRRRNLTISWSGIHRLRRRPKGLVCVSSLTMIHPYRLVATAPSSETLSIPR